MREGSGQEDGVEGIDAMTFSVSMAQDLENN